MLGVCTVTSRTSSLLVPAVEVAKAIASRCRSRLNVLNAHFVVAVDLESVIAVALIGVLDLPEQAHINILRNATEALCGHSTAETRIEVTARCRKDGATSMWPTMAQA